MDKLDDHLPVGLQGRGHDVLVRTVVSPAYGTELDTRHPCALEVDDVARAVAAYADGIAAEVARRDLAERLHVGVPARYVGRFAVEQDLDLGGQVHGAYLPHDLLRVLVREEAEVEVVRAAVWYAVEYVASDDAREVHARVGEKVAPLFREGQVEDPAVVLVREESGVLAQPGLGTVGALTTQRHPDVEHTLRLGADMEVCRLAGDQEVSDVAVGDQDLSARLRTVLALLIGDDEELDRGFAAKGLQVFDGVHHRGEGALHVVDAATVELVLLLARLELRFVARHHVDVAVQEYPWITGPHAHHERGQLPAGPCACIAHRLEPTRPEPAVDKVHRGLRGAWRVRPVAYKLPGERMDLGVLGYYRQKILRYSDASKCSLYFSTPPCRRLVRNSACARAGSR